ncbi:MAG: MMPL family transporter [Chlamydiae bacterium]|nr:MMPL family transporter [Chlamydiota bacterium]MBI3266813.1 MMPL family transporter [Chlamydiota bacterium]
MKIERLTQFVLDHPKLVIGATLAFTLLFAAQFPKIAIDTDPKHMLPATSPVRQYNDQVERDFALHPDVIVLGIVNSESIFNPQTLKTIKELTRAIQEIPGVISRDVDSLTTVDNVSSINGELVVKPALGEIPQSDAELATLRKALLGNSLFVNRFISADSKTAAIFIPIEPTANGKEIADKIRWLLPKGSGKDQFYIAGDPVARDTFGTEMFRQMALFSPIAGIVMCISLWFMFRNVTVIIANMAVAMISIIWSMGGLIGLGYPVHIMSSMSPVFLMAIATDAVHIFNEFAFRLNEVKDKHRAILETMKVVGPPVFYSDLTTAVGFAALATGSIIPVTIFGWVVGFGTVVILLMSYTLVPAILVLVPEKHILKMMKSGEGKNQTPFSWLSHLGKFCVERTQPILVVGLVLMGVATVGLACIRVNNNMVNWFKRDSVVRTADRVMNQHLGGTSTAYLVVQGQEDGIIGTPALLSQIEGLERELEKDPLVGKTFSVVDYIKRVNRVLHDNDPAFDRIPDTEREVGQYLFLLESAAKPRHLDNVIDFPSKTANVILQLKSWDAGVMEKVAAQTDAFLAAHPLPKGTTVKPAGIAYFNKVWNHEVLWGMLSSFLWGLVFVLILLMIETRSFLWGALSFLPLLFTIAFIYGVVGLIGKDFDMPVAVLSTLSLGMAVDFAIHFVSRFRKRLREKPDLKEALIWAVARPGKGIFLNAILFALGFAVMGFADLTPYITVGILMAAMMVLSSVASVIYLPALIQLGRRKLVKEDVR